MRLIAGLMLLPVLIGLAACVSPDKQMSARDLKYREDPTCRTEINSQDVTDCQSEKAEQR